MVQPPALSLYRPLPGARSRIVAFPHAGGGASAFVKLRAALAPYRIELCPLQLPGRENRIQEPLPAAIEDVATEFAAAIKNLPPLPSAFLGHSLGGLVAYLTACQLRDDAIHTPDHLLVSASLSPVLGRLPDSSRTPMSMRERIISYGGIPEAILADDDLFDMFASIIVADIPMGDASHHRAPPPLTCPITVYSGTNDRAVPPGKALAWQQLTVRDLNTRSFDGDHFFLYAKPEATAAALAEDLGILTGVC